MQDMTVIWSPAQDPAGRDVLTAGKRGLMGGAVGRGAGWGGYTRQNNGAYGRVMVGGGRDYKSVGGLP